MNNTVVQHFLKRVSTIKFVPECLWLSLSLPLRSAHTRSCDKFRAPPSVLPIAVGRGMRVWLETVVLSCSCHVISLPFISTNPSFSPQGHSIAVGNLRPPSRRSSVSTGSNRSREPARRANTTSNFGMMNVDRSRTRRERTFVGSECAVCEEPLEHTLRGERILQFSCSHVSHEACFYEFIREFESQYCPTCNAPLHLDTSRGGNVLDIGMY